jgi:hypothetical protein
MGRELKLNLYEITVREIGDSKNPNLTYGEIYKHFSNSSDERERFRAFAGAYLRSFNGAFRMDRTGTKSISPKVGAFRLNSLTYQIYGMMNGGMTNAEMSYFDNNDNAKPAGKIDRNKVTGLERFVFMYFPPDSQVGIVMIQNYSDSSLSAVILEDIKAFFKEYKLLATPKPFVPEADQKKFLEESYIYRISLNKKNPPNSVRTNFHPFIPEDQDFGLQLNLTRLRVRPETIIDAIRQKGGSLFTKDFLDLGIPSIMDGYEVQLHYRNPEGNSSAKIEKVSDEIVIAPTIRIGNYVKQEGLDIPDPVKIKDFCVEKLKTIKREMYGNEVLDLEEVDVSEGEEREENFFIPEANDVPIENDVR